MLNYETAAVADPHNGLGQVFCHLIFNSVEEGQTAAEAARVT